MADSVEQKLSVEEATSMEQVSSNTRVKGDLTASEVCDKELLEQIALALKDQMSVSESDYAHLFVSS